MDKRSLLKSVAALTLLAIPGAAIAQDTVKIGLILPMTGQQASTGSISAAVKLYQAENGDTVAGKKVEVILKDDGAVPDNTKRIAQEPRVAFARPTRWCPTSRRARISETPSRMRSRKPAASSWVRCACRWPIRTSSLRAAGEGSQS